MPKYIAYYFPVVEEESIEIIADNEEEALKKFFKKNIAGEFDRIEDENGNTLLEM